MCEDNANYTTYRLCDVHTCDELVKGVMNTDDCEETHTGCACIENYFLNDDGDCVHPEKCFECVHDNVTYQVCNIILVFKINIKKDKKDNCKELLIFIFIFNVT